MIEASGSSNFFEPSVHNVGHIILVSTLLAVVEFVLFSFVESVVEPRLFVPALVLVLVLPGIPVGEFIFEIDAVVDVEGVGVVVVVEAVEDELDGVLEDLSCVEGIFVVLRTSFKSEVLQIYAVRNKISPVIVNSISHAFQMFFKDAV